jgi:dihydroorotate dehydrogenase (NAD+) catalytic subunit
MTLGPVELRNPLICGSGEHVADAEGLASAVDAGAAAVVAKSANESDAARRQSQATSWTFLDGAWNEVAPGRGASMLNRSGLVAEPWERWLEILAEADAHARARGSWVVASVIPADERELPRLAADVQDAGLRWLELNLSAPHAGEAAPGAIERPSDPRRAAALTAAAREAVDIPLTVKLGVENADVVALARAVREAGADAVAMVGRHMGFLPDPATRRPVLGSFGGYSGPWSLPIAARWLAKTRAALGRNVPLVGTNGARDGLDVARLMLAGASAVQVTTSVIAEGFGALARILRELTDYLAAQQLDAHELVGEAADSVMTYEEAAARWRQ